jgi:hypothetical protein
MRRRRSMGSMGGIRKGKRLIEENSPMEKSTSSIEKYASPRTRTPA